MSAVEYSLIFLSIVIGYVVTTVMVGWGKLIKYFDFQKLSIEYLLWSFILFLYLLFMWFWTFSFYLEYLDNYFWFTMMLIRPLLIYFCLEVLVPDRHDEYDYRVHFWNVKRKFFILVSVLWLYEISLKLIQDQSISFNRHDIIYLIGLPTSVSLIFIKNRKYVRWATILSFAFMLLLLGSEMLLQYIYGA